MSWRRGFYDPKQEFPQTNAQDDRLSRVLRSGLRHAQASANDKLIEKPLFSLEIRTKTIREGPWALLPLPRRRLTNDVKTRVVFTLRNKRWDPAIENRPDVG